MPINVRRKLLLALTILSAPHLASCDKKVAVKATKPPVELLTCQSEPVAPDLPAPGIERDRIVLSYLLAMRAAWGDCSAKVQGVRAWSEAMPD